MVVLAYLALFGIPLLAALLILTYRGSATVVAASIIGGWMSMPLLSVKLRGVPELDKATLLGLIVLGATCVTRLGRLSRLRPRWFDLPILILCVAPIGSSLNNGLGFYDGISRSFQQAMIFGAPYVVGRIVCVDRAALSAVGRVLLLAVVAYTPLCLIESRLSPQLHEWIYGMPGRVGWERVAFWGPLQWKPSVFLQSPLELTPLMGVGFLFGWWLWRRGRVVAIGGFPVNLLVPIALLATLLGKSLGGCVLTLGSLCVIWVSWRFQTRVFVIAMLAVAPAYIFTRTAGLWNGAELVQFVQEHVSVRRAESLQFRMANEDLLVAKALERPALGWGGWGRSRVYDEEGRNLTVTDGLWVISFGTSGMLGLASWIATLLVPAWLAAKRFAQCSTALERENAVELVCAVILGLHAIDCLANAMTSPVYLLISGGVCSAIANSRRSSAGLTRAAGPERIRMPRASQGLSTVRA